MNGLAEVIRQRFDPRDTMIVGFDSHFLGYRHAGYYLAEYLTVQYPEVRYAQGMRVFQIQDRDTRLTGRLNLKRYSRFVVFPLPHDAASDDYLRMALSRFHPKTLRTEPVGAEVFVTGSIADLPVLFPHTMR